MLTEELSGPCSLPDESPLLLIHLVSAFEHRTFSPKFQRRTFFVLFFLQLAGELVQPAPCLRSPLFCSPTRFEQKILSFLLQLAEEFVQRWIHMPSPAVCGTWQEKYANLHRSIRSGKQPKFYITFNGFLEPRLGIATAGMGDYLQGMVTTFLLALVTNRSFIMHESPLTEVVDHHYIDWRLRGDVPMAFGRNGEWNILLPLPLLSRRCSSALPSIMACARKKQHVRE